MIANLTRRDFAKAAAAAAILASTPGSEATAQLKAMPDAAAGSSPDQRAQTTEAQMTDDERFSLIVSLIGAVPSLGISRDPVSQPRSPI